MIVEQFHSAAAAEQAAAEFDRVFANKELPSDMPEVAVDEGELADNDTQLIQRLRKAVSRNGWRGRDVFCLASGASMATFSFVMPRLSAREMPDALRLRLRDAVHFDTSDAYIDYEVGKEVQSGQYRVTVVAAESRLVARARRSPRLFPRGYRDG